MEEKKKVLIVTYYWPPSGGVGVMRWLKFAKYLPEFGWQPIIYTPENPDFDLKDDSLSNDIHPETVVLKRKIFEPYFILKLIPGKNKSTANAENIVSSKKKSGFLKGLLGWIRANLLVPDPRVFWVAPSVRFLKSYLKENKIDVLVTTGPPQSMHLIGLQIKKQIPDIKWLADFRDPWSNWDFNKKLAAGSFAKKRHQNLEKQVLKHADIVTTIGPRLAADFESISKRKVEVLYNGHDTDEFKKNQISPERSSFFEICHFGILGELRNPEVLWDALEELGEDATFLSQLKINLAGTVSEDILDRINKSRLSNCLLYEKYIDRASVLERYQRASLLILLLNKSDNAPWILPVKMFEYLTLNKPVLCLGPKNSDAGQIIQTAGVGKIFEYDEKIAIKEFINQVYRNQFEIDHEKVTPIAKQFERKAVTKNLVELLNELSS